MDLQWAVQARNNCYAFFQSHQHYNSILKGIKMAENTEKKEVKTKKASTAKTTAKPKAPAAKKETTSPKNASTAKTGGVKKPAAKKTKAATADLEQRYKMIEVAAYYIAEKDGFASSPVEYWIAAELQIGK
jgi:hypothetical protein